MTSDETYKLTVSGSHVTMNGKDYSPVTFVNRKAAQLNRTDHFASWWAITTAPSALGCNMIPRRGGHPCSQTCSPQRMEANKTYPNTFHDVPKNFWAANYIGYVQQFGIISGYADGSFRPNAPVTRAEFAVIASRFEKLTEGGKHFTDVPSAHWPPSISTSRPPGAGSPDMPTGPLSRKIPSPGRGGGGHLPPAGTQRDQGYIRSHLNGAAHLCRPDRGITGRTGTPW